MCKALNLDIGDGPSETQWNETWGGACILHSMKMFWSSSANSLSYSSPVPTNSTANITGACGSRPGLLNQDMLQCQSWDRDWQPPLQSQRNSHVHEPHITVSFSFLDLHYRWLVSLGLASLLSGWVHWWGQWWNTPSLYSLLLFLVDCTAQLHWDPHPCLWHRLHTHWTAEVFPVTHKENIRAGISGIELCACLRETQSSKSLNPQTLRT